MGRYHFIRIKTEIHNIDFFEIKCTCVPDFSFHIEAAFIASRIYTAKTILPDKR